MSSIPDAENKIYDMTGREIMIGDVLKVYHFTGARRKRHYMYKQVIGTRQFRDGTTVLDVSHLDLTSDTYPLIRDGERLLDHEIIQSLDCKYEERPRAFCQRQRETFDNV